MISTRYLYLLMILVFLSSSCTKTQTISPVPTVTPISTKTPTITVIPTSPEPVAEPLCFTPRELLPFTFSPDSSDLLIRSAQGVQVIDLESGQEKDFISSTGMVVTAALSPNAEILAWSLDNNTIQLIRMLDRLSWFSTCRS